MNLASFDFSENPWKPLSRPAAIAWSAVYALFLVYAARNSSGFLFIDNANLVVHEGGHLLFAWFGQTLCLWGGTILQWLVPALLAAYFFYDRHIAGFVFSTFVFFENWLYTATYICDARAQQLPLVTVGDPDTAGHDWNLILSSLGLLDYDTRIGSTVRVLGWCGMLACFGWMLWRSIRPSSREA